MTTTKMHDLTFQQLEDGTIRLEQQWGIDDPYSIDLHPSQLRYVAEAIGLLEPSKLPEQPRALKKRLERPPRPFNRHSRRPGSRSDIPARFRFVGRRSRGASTVECHHIPRGCSGRLLSGNSLRTRTGWKAASLSCN